ncbi:7390_t:CDS:1, partial [Racocetra persica]
TSSCLLKLRSGPESTLAFIAGLTTRISPALLTISAASQLLSQSIRALAAIKLASKMSPPPAA